MTQEITRKSVLNMLEKHFNSLWVQVTRILMLDTEKLYKVVNAKTILHRVFHIVETIEFYFGNHPDDMNWGLEVGINWDEMESDFVLSKMRMYTVEQFEMYIKRIKTIAAAGLSHQSLEAKPEGFWFDSYLDLFMYVLRHSNWHFGEIYELLRQSSVIIHWM